MNGAQVTEQNVRVWSRRFSTINTGADREAQAKKLNLNHGRQLALTIVAINYAIDNGVSKEHAVDFGKLAGKVTYDCVYGEMHGGNVLAMYGQAAGAHGNLLALYASELCAFTSKAIASRTGEYNKPNLANVVLGKVRR